MPKRSLEELSRALDDPSDEVAKRAARELVARGSEGSMVLAKVIGDSSDSSRAERTQGWLVDIGPDAIPTFLIVVGAERGIDLRHNPGIHLISQMGEAAVARLTKAALDDPTKNIRLAAVASLRILSLQRAETTGVAGPSSWHAPVSAPHALVEVVRRSADPEVASVAADALAFSTAAQERPSSEVIDTLSNALKHADPRVRARAASALATLNVGSSDELVIHVLAGVTSDDASVRADCSLGVGRLVPTKEVVRVLSGGLHTAEDPGIVRPLAEALCGMGPAGQAAVVSEIRNSAMAKKQTILGSVQYCAPLPPSFVPVALNAMDQLPPQDRELAIQALGNVREPGDAAVRKLIGLLNVPTQAAASAWALRKIGAPARAAIPALMAVVENSPDRITRRSAVEALGAMGPHGKATIATLRLVWDKELADPVAMSLARMGSASIPALVGGLRHPEPDVRDRSAWAIRYLGREGAPAVAGLVTALDDQSPKVRNSAAQALGTIGPAASAAVGKLADRLVTDPDASVRAWCAHALGSIGVASPAAIEALEQAKQSADTGVRSEAIGASAAIRWADGARQMHLTTSNRAAPLSETVFKTLDDHYRTGGEPSRRMVEVALAAGLERPASQAARQSLHLASLSSNVAVQLAAANALTVLGWASETDLRNVHEALRDPHHPTRVSAAVALLAHGSCDDACKSVIVAAMGGTFSDSPSYVLWELERARVRVDWLAGPLAESLAQRGSVRLLAATLLGTIGPSARPALAALRPLTWDEQDAVRWAALDAIDRIEGRKR